MNANPYSPTQHSDALSVATNQKKPWTSSITGIGILAGSVAFVSGITGINLLQRSAVSPANLPLSYTIAETVAWCGMAVVLMLTLATGVPHVGRRLTAQAWPGKRPARWGWNLLPASVACLIGLAWCGLSLLGFYSLTLELRVWSYLRGMPLLELALQLLLYASGLAACLYGFLAVRHWARRSYQPAWMYTALAIFAPIISYFALFRVAEPLIRFLI